MGNIPNAKMSPRISNGVLKWYYLDTFDLQLTLDLTDQDGEAITIASSDTVKVVFKDSYDAIIKEFEFTGIIDNTIALDFDAECTELFKKGSYTYDVYYIGTDRTTIANDNKVAVE